jgi:hypothetical protein
MLLVFCSLLKGCIARSFCTGKNL